MTIEISSETGQPIFPETEGEREVTGEIVLLWAAHQEKKASMRCTKHELASLRFALGEKLLGMKFLLTECGRGGRWASYLRAHNIPRTTADRYVREQERMLNLEPEKCTSGAIVTPTEADVRKFFQRLLPRLRKTLTTDEAVCCFVKELLATLSTAECRITDSGLEIFGTTEKDDYAQTQEVPLALESVSQ